MKKIQSELIIIGGGIAGVSSAVYAKRAGLNLMLFEGRGIGGQLLLMENIDNYVGIAQGTKGRDLTQTLVKTMEQLQIEPIIEEIVKLEVTSQGVDAYSQQNHYSAQAVIIATGASFKKLGVPGEDEFIGRGVSYCAVCDGFFFKDKDVCVVGGGNTAAEEALYLSKIARKVYLLHRRDQLRAMDYLQKKLREKKNIEIIYNCAVKQVNGDRFLTELLIENVNTRKEERLSLQGLFVAIGVKPNTGLFKEVISLDEEGFILTDEYMNSSSALIWACGDCRRRPLKQLVTAASEGAVAALSAYRRLRDN